MDMTTLERAARAVSDAFPLTNGADAYAQPPQFKLGDKTCLDIACAVLMAVRDGPTTGTYQQVVKGEMFAAMIDAILAEGE